MVENYNEVLYDNEVLETKRLILRRFIKNDASDILEYASDSETTKYLDWSGVETKEEALKGIYNYYWSKPGIFAIELAETRKCIGAIDLRLIPEHEKASFGYVLNRKYWNKGYMTEALSALLRLCFEKLELNRVESQHYVGNEGSGKVMSKCGMELEGIGIQETLTKGTFRDTVHYGLTKKHWLQGL